jgi:RHS repeat-associated protein
MSSATHRLPKRVLFYQNGRQIIELGAQSRKTCLAGNTPLAQFCPQDRRTSLLQTDQSNSVLSNNNTNIAYSPYGFTDAGAVHPMLTFTGQAYDDFSGSYALGAGHRFYNPSLMRFIQPDGLSPFDKGGINSYAYCQDDPVNRLDPSGQYFEGLRRAGTWLLDSVLEDIGMHRRGNTITARIDRNDISLTLQNSQLSLVIDTPGGRRADINDLITFSTEIVARTAERLTNEIDRNADTYALAPMLAIGGTTIMAVEFGPAAIPIMATTGAIIAGVDQLTPSRANNTIRQ